MLPDASRTYHDPLHGAIVLEGSDPTESLLIQLIDTPAFQRLRRLRQLGPASLTFHGAEGSRFTHSLGVMAIARRAFDGIARHYPQLQSQRPVVLAAALLHDLGHGPFSHTSEEIFGNHHEHWTSRILRESSPIRELLAGFQPDLIDRIRSYPTTIFVNADQSIKAIHTGFTGPATGKAYKDLKTRFESIIAGWLK